MRQTRQASSQPLLPDIVIQYFIMHRGAIFGNHPAKEHKHQNKLAAKNRI